MVKAVAFPGNTITASVYDDSEDFSGPLQTLFQSSMSFIKRNLRKVQAGQSVNSPGKPEIPMAVFEELLVNALIHRDYLIEAPIRLFVFSDRIEIVSPGHLPNNLTVEKIRTGNSNIRNPILASYVAKGMLPYHGIGSGIKRALEDWPDIRFTDDRDGCLFTATVTRKTPLKTPLKTPEKSRVQSNVISNVKSKVKNSDRLLQLLGQSVDMTIPELALTLGLSLAGVEKIVRNLKKVNRLRRIGPDKGGHWEIVK